MVNFDEIEFLESEIVDDDPDAPVGTLVHISDDGKVEEVSPAPGDAVENEPVAQDVADEPVEDEAEQVEEVSDTNDNEVEDAAQNVEDVQEPTNDTLDEQIEEVSDETTEQVADDAKEEVEDALDVQDDTTVDVTSEQEDVAEEETIEEEVVEDPVTEQPVEEVQETVEEPVEQAVEEPVIEQVEQEPVAEQAEVQSPVQEEVPQEVKPVAPKKPRKKAVKKEEPVKEAPKVTASSTGINLKSGRDVNSALFDTSFEIEQPTKTKVVSTKKKQEKTEDLWAVAVVAKPTKTTAPKKAKAEEPKQEVEPKKAAAKKSAPKKSTKVENTDNSTEEKKVAKTTDKTATETKTTKKTAVTAEVKEEKVVKAKAPAKEEKAAKTAPVKEEAPAKAEKAPKATAKADNDETVIVEGEGKTHGKYVIKKTDKGNFVFKLYSSNFRVVAIGAQAYTTLGAAKIGIQSVINNAEKAPIENQTLKNYETLKFPKWEIYLDKKGEYRLRLYATNGSLIATTNDGYTDISGAKNGIAAVGRASKGCAIVRNDNLW